MNFRNSLWNRYVYRYLVVPILLCFVPKSNCSCSNSENMKDIKIDKHYSIISSTGKPTNYQAYHFPSGLNTIIMKSKINNKHHHNEQQDDLSSFVIL